MWGFQCLHYAVSESSGYLNVKVLNKTKRAGRIGVRTVLMTDGAKPEKDFDPVDEILDFGDQDFKLVKITIHDDDQWDPDKEFKVELYDPTTSKKLSHSDTHTLVTIIDDDKPGFLSFEAKRA